MCYFRKRSRNTFVLRENREICDLEVYYKQVNKGTLSPFH